MFQAAATARPAWLRMAIFVDGSERFATMPKRTYQPKRIPRKREHGFLKRMHTRGGRAILGARRRKGRHKLTVADEKKPTQR
jgi:large subunit ribosomal protein L34